MTGLRVAIVTSGRFHVLDLARELAALGHQVAFYSHVPRRRAEQFGLPPECHRGLLPYVFPLVALQRKAPGWLKHFPEVLLQLAIDRIVARILEPCDVFIGMSGLCVESARRARILYAAQVFLERGSRHVLSQKEILEAIPRVRRPAVPEFNVKRELRGYDFADVISVPSRHVERSFAERGIGNSRIFRNPYGVDLRMFQPTPSPPPGQHPTVIFTGTWCLQKGCDVLWKACRSANSWHLLHVGAVGDLEVPRSPLFTHMKAVPQWQLAEMYGKAHVFVHPSRQEGLSLVQAQALACGLPLVCTDRTGGEDLREVITDPDWVTVVPHDDAEALGQAIERALAKAARHTGVRDILGSARERLSWRAYGQRYSAEIQRRCHSEREPANARRN